MRRYRRVFDSRTNVEFEKSDQEQVEALQQWWKDNWLSLLGGLVLGLGGILGWQYYGQYSDAQAAQASNAYESIKSKLATEQLDAASTEIETLAQAHPKSPYVPQAQLALAKAQADAGEWAAAEASLRSVIDGDAESALHGLAILRLARALWAQDKGDEAVALLDGAPDNSYAPLYSDLKGDIAAAAGDLDAARAAYQTVLASNADYIDNNSVQQKLDALN